MLSLEQRKNDILFKLDVIIRKEKSANFHTKYLQLFVNIANIANIANCL